MRGVSGAGRAVPRSGRDSQIDNISCIDYATVVDEGLHIDAAKARRLLQQIVESGVLRYSIHTRDQMIARRITVQDVENTLRAGLVEPSEFEHGSWRHRVKTNTICVVVTLLSEQEAVVVTTWRIRR